MAKQKKTKPGRPRGRPPVPPVTADTPLSDDEERYVQEYLIDRNCAQAYRRCYPEASYASCLRLGNTMRHRVNVDAEIKAGLAAQRVRSRVSADEVLKELARIAFSDVYELYDPHTNQLRQPRHIPYDTRKVIASLRVARTRTTRTTVRRTTTTVSDQIIEYKLWSKVDALAKLMKHLGLEGGLEPLDVLLAALPRRLADEVRAELSAERAALIAAPASTNGNGKH